MIRWVWNMLSVLAIANMLGLVGFLVFLMQTDRLGMDRVHDARELFAETRTAQAIREKKEQEEADQAAAAADAALRAQRPPISADDRVQVVHETEEQQREILDRYKADMEKPLEDLRRREQKLERDREQFEEQVAKFEAERQRIAETEGAAQFKQAVKMLASQEPAQAQSILQAMIDADEGDIERATLYLASMPNRNAAEALGAFDPDMAQRLIERLRTRGVEPDAS